MHTNTTFPSKLVCLTVTLLSATPGIGAAQQTSEHSVGIVEFEALSHPPAVSGGDAVTQPMAGFGAGWGGDAQLFWRPAGLNDRLVATFGAPSPGAYDVTLYYTVAPDFGDFLVTVGDSEGTTVSGYEPGVALRSVSLGRHQLDALSNQLAFTVKGRVSESTGYIVGLDRVELIPVDEQGVAASMNMPQTTFGMPGSRPGFRAKHVRDEFVAIEDGLLRLGYVSPEGGLVLLDEEPVFGSLFFTGNFDGKPGDELLSYDPAVGDYWLFNFDRSGVAVPPELVRQSVPFEADIFRTTGRFADSSSSCLFGWRQGEAFSVARVKDGVCFHAAAYAPIDGIAFAADVSGDGRDEAVFVDHLGTIDVAVLGAAIPHEDPNRAPRLEHSIHRAAERWAPGLELTHADLDGDGAEELLVVIRPAGEVWRLSFDATGEVIDRQLVATGLPAGSVLIWPHDANGDGRDELLVRDGTTRDLKQARWNPETSRLEMVELEGLTPSFVYTGRFFGDGRESLLLQHVVPGKGSRLEVVGFSGEGMQDRDIDDQRLEVPEQATIVVGDFVMDER